MGPVKAKEKGCVEVEGIDITFSKGEDVTELAEQVSPDAYAFLMSEQGLWEDVSEAVNDEKAKMQEKLKAIAKAKKASEDKKAAKKVKP